MSIFWSALPRSYVAFVQPPRLIVLRYGLSPFRPGSFAERWEYPLNGLADLPDAFLAVRKKFRPTTDDTWRLCLPL